MPSILLTHLRAMSCAVTTLVIVGACITPTDVCGCTTAPSELHVSGTVRSAQGVAIANVQVSIRNRPVGFPNTTFATAGRPTFTTDSLGRFLAVTSNPVPGRSEIQGRFIRPSATDTIVVDFGVADLRLPGAPGDTLRVAVVVPWAR